MTFDLALQYLKDGYGVYREMWFNAQYVKLQKAYPQGIPCNKQTAECWGLQEGDLFKCNPYFQVKNLVGSFSMWAPSVDDILADDWMVIDDE